MTKNRNICIFYVVLALLLFAIAFGGCEGGGGDVPKYGRFAHLGLNAKTEKQIIQDYFEQFADYNDPNFLYTLNDFSIAGYGGTYNGNVVTVIYPDLMVRSQVYRPRPIWTYKSKKYVLLYADECMVWKQGQFWTFNDFNILYPFSDEELKSINKCLNPGCPF